MLIDTPFTARLMNHGAARQPPTAGSDRWWHRCDKLVPRAGVEPARYVLTTALLLRISRALSMVFLFML